MSYEFGSHYDSHPIAEVESALSANSLESVQQTLENRLATAEGRRVPQQAEIDRIAEQLSYIGTLALVSSAA